MDDVSPLHFILLKDSGTIDYGLTNQNRRFRKSIPRRILFYYLLFQFEERGLVLRQELWNGIHHR